MDASKYGDSINSENCHRAQKVFLWTLSAWEIGSFACWNINKLKE